MLHFCILDKERDLFSICAAQETANMDGSKIAHQGAAHRLLETELSVTADHVDTGRVDSVSEAEHSGNSRLLYVSHLLSTWNSRLFEFGAYLFLAKIYPRTLLPASVYALTRAGAAAIFSPWLGRYVDTGERLSVVRMSIGKQRPE